MSEQEKASEFGIFGSQDVLQKYLEWLNNPMTRFVHENVEKMVDVSPVVVPLDQQSRQLGVIQGWHGCIKAQRSLAASSGSANPSLPVDDEYGARLIMEKELGIKKQGGE